VDNYFLLKRSIPCPWNKKGEVMRKLMKFTEERKRELIDGVRVLNEGSWVLVAPDRRKASFYIFAESDKKSTAEKQLQEYADKVFPLSSL